MSRLPLKESRAETSLLRSRFIVFAFPLRDVASFLSLYQKVKADYPGADHYPYAYRVGVNEKASDDGEPSGAAGRPFLALLQKKDLDQVALVAVRYFGGSKLGLPRLTRTFLGTAVNAVDHLALGEEVLGHKVKLSLSYHDYEILQKRAETMGLTLSEVSFSSNVDLLASGDATIFTSLSALGIPQEAITDLGPVKTIKEIQS
ncbi:MAG: IMPACT family member YigZ [Tenericutes bacterium ADurb.BinA155]|jgi:putative IMPACT (imprinted ancient) family translation regulator|nr:MAG: IMPACT family member YigZ [Tenericutes bacterium ADurb.BinA155]